MIREQKRNADLWISDAKMSQEFCVAVTCRRLHRLSSVITDSDVVAVRYGDLTRSIRGPPTTAMM